MAKRLQISGDRRRAFALVLLIEQKIGDIGGFQRGEIEVFRGKKKKKEFEIVAISVERVLRETALDA